MNKEFIPYEQALEFKEIGFDEPCLKFYATEKLVLGLDTNNGDTNSKLSMYNPLFISAPTYSQAFRWFREKDLYCIIYKYHDGFAYEVYGEGLQIIKEPFNTYEEAELACLKKLIEIIKQPKQ